MQIALVYAEACSHFAVCGLDCHRGPYRCESLVLPLEAMAMCLSIFSGSAVQLGAMFVVCTLRKLKIHAPTDRKEQGSSISSDEQT